MNVMGKSIPFYLGFTLQFSWKNILLYQEFVLSLQYDSLGKVYAFRDYSLEKAWFKPKLDKK